MNSNSVVISQAPPKRSSQNYAVLRESGMEFIRQLAKESWTDHNLHDPGITLLEAFSYAMTELGFRIQLDIPDLLRSGTHNARPDLQPAHHVLPCAPVTPRDMRKVMLDHPLLRDARITTNARSELAFFELPADNDPPFTYTENNSLANVHGLFEANLEFRQRELNSNTYTIFVGPEEDPYTLDIALPYWDENEVRPFRDGPVIDTVTMLADEGSVIWHPLDESQSYYSEIRVDYTNPDGSDSTVLWVLLRIIDEIEDPAGQIPGILNDALTEVQLVGEGSLIHKFTQRVQSANGAVKQIQRYLSSWRNLCEDPVRITVARVQEIAVSARIEVTGSSDLEQMLADIFIAIDRMLVPPIRFIDITQRRQAHASDVESIFDGPLLRHGFLDDVANTTEEADQIYTSDILRLIMRRRDITGTDLVAQENPSGRDIVAVTDLALSNYINNRPITMDAQNCLNLVETARYRPRLSLSKSHIVFVRNDEEVLYDMQRVESLFTDKRQADEEASLPVNPSSVWPVVQGEELPVEDYIPIQNDLPRVYGVGEARLPESVGTEHRAAVLQLKGYLLLFEQFLADLTAQLGNINRFFSSSPDEKLTYFSLALFDLPDVQKLLVRSPPDPNDWKPFIDDPDNPYMNALHQALEGKKKFLDRRNRMLDHLLARQGEEMVAYSQELHRYAQKELLEGEIDTSDIRTYMLQRRQAANARLIRAKAALLHDIPQLNGIRLQAFGNPLQRRTDIVQIEQDDAGFNWIISLDGQSVLRNVNSYANHAAAVIAAEEAVVLAAQQSDYVIVSAAGRKQYQLEDSSGLSTRVIAKSPQTYASVSTAETAAQACAQQFNDLRLSGSQTPLEQRLVHLCGFRQNGRRRLLTAIDDFFEIYDEVDSDGIIEKRWRLWEYAGRTGRVMLSSVFHFEAATDTEAEAMASEAIYRVIRYGQDEWNYTVSPAGTNTYNFDLRHPSGAKIGLRNPPYPSEAAARVGIDETIKHLYHHYSAEGFHLVEHLLLRPQQAGDEFLSLPDGPAKFEQDPYSQRLSLIFPSGYMRDFSLPAEDTTEPDNSAPHRFRDMEFRQHVERMVQQACPAHLLPSIYWVDRQLSDTPDTSGENYSFDDFELAYFNWLNTILIPGIAPEDIRAARNELVLALNGVANG